jgi:hypothetical protein
MATSGAYSFTMSRDDIIKAALRLTTRYSADDAIPPEDMSYCAQALNLLCKEMVTDFLPLWCVQDLAIPLITGTEGYNLSTASNTTLPLRILDCYIRSATNNDRQIKIVSRYDFDLLGNKLQQGQPNQAWYDPQLGAGILHLYNPPVDTLSTLHVIIQRQVQDFNLSTDNPDFPQEAFRLLKWALADEISLEYFTPRDIRQEIGFKAAGYRQKFADGAMEQASVTFTPSGRY